MVPLEQTFQHVVRILVPYAGDQRVAQETNSFHDQGGGGGIMVMTTVGCQSETTHSFATYKLNLVLFSVICKKLLIHTYLARQSRLLSHVN
eukprot:m.110329 g.110329  ORF g.110329 m.110329 type:complete len:91 (+) comp13395_c1_seq7:886-1158(+)